VKVVIAVLAAGLNTHIVNPVVVCVPFTTPHADAAVDVPAVGVKYPVT
jgi:hypothetical protein